MAPGELDRVVALVVGGYGNGGGDVNERGTGF